MLEKGIAVIGSTTIDKNIYDNKNQLKIGGVTTYSVLSRESPIGGTEL